MAMCTSYAADKLIRPCLILFAYYLGPPCRPKTVFIGRVSNERTNFLLRPRDELRTKFSASLQTSNSPRMEVYTLDLSSRTLLCYRDLVPIELFYIQKLQLSDSYKLKVV
jgi:hypothetical protein